jgi:hypothetical protein
MIRSFQQIMRLDPTSVFTRATGRNIPVDGILHNKNTWILYLFTRWAQSVAKET